MNNAFTFYLTELGLVIPSLKQMDNFIMPKLKPVMPKKTDFKVLNIQLLRFLKGTQQLKK